jgi:V-type H+-transporting ATPase subunit a
MSIFSMYCGAIYNECFAIPMDAFGSRWNLTHDHTYVYNSNFKYPYPFGVDPVWKGSGNELLFYNSVKMKMSVILGVLQMSLGIFMN